MGFVISFLLYDGSVGNQKHPAVTTRIEEHRLKGKRKGALLREQIWIESGVVTRYSLAYINLRICSTDNGRVLGYDNSHEYHHRHLMGDVEPFDFHSFEGVARRFYQEVHELWRLEDEAG